MIKDGFRGVIWFDDGCFTFTPWTATKEEAEKLVKELHKKSKRAGRIEVQRSFAYSGEDLK